MGVMELLGHLKNHERRLEGHTLQPVANAVQARTFGSNNGGRVTTGGSANQLFDQRGNNQGQHGGGLGNCGRGGRGRGIGLQCQICSKPGHTALKCWNLFDHDFQPPPSPQDRAVLAPPHAPHEGWFVDSGATHHMVADTKKPPRMPCIQGPVKFRWQMDSLTKKVLLQVPLRDGLYHLPVSKISSPFALLIKALSVDMWQRRFGHSSALSHLANKLGVSVSNVKPF